MRKSTKAIKTIFEKLQERVWTRTIGYLYAKVGEKEEPCSISHLTQKINSKRIRDINIKSVTINFLLENTEENHSDPGLGKEFLTIA